MSCEQSASRETVFQKGTYGYDAGFLKKHLKQVTELTNKEGARVLITGDLQGRVMTSTTSGDSGNSFGWINYALIEEGALKPQFNPFGGEERFWIGPEGGQYSFYFKKGSSFEFGNWQVPPFIDTVAYTVVSSEPEKVVFAGNASLENFSGTVFDIEVNRTIRLLDKTALSERIGKTVPDDVKWVAYETGNVVKNTGAVEWKKETGLFSVWLLGMFIPSEETVAIIPFKNVDAAKEHITDNYFGQIPADRLIVKDSVLLLKCDGKYRSKLGLSPVITRPVAGSFDYQKNILTCILYTVEAGGEYVNSKWEIQTAPYKGDVVNAYNDGPLEDGSQMGPFYELESSSAAKALKPGESLEYKQVTCHFEGSYVSLNALAQRLLGINLDDARLP
ncbi:MAG: hypothetical protein KIT80_19995 [Chitinophagaceae bacterium]|nr:hypothetical protein [Chitinophagaceae bacterium]MCW5929213.1 hypothetical protein [Chitinophagaceae bacterium]